MPANLLYESHLSGKELSTMHFIDLHENQIYIRLAVTDNRDLKLLHFSALPLKEEGPRR